MRRNIGLYYWELTRYWHNGDHRIPNQYVLLVPQHLWDPSLLHNPWGKYKLEISLLKKSNENVIFTVNKSYVMYVE